MMGATKKEIAQMMLDAADDAVECARMFWAGSNAVRPESDITTSLKLLVG